MESCPHVFFAGNQPQFATGVVEGDVPLRLNGTDTDTDMEMADATGPRVRLLTVPKFNETGELILVDSETLEVEVVKFGAFMGEEEKK